MEEYYPVRLPGLGFLLCHLLLCNLGWVFQLPFLEPHSLLFTLILNCVYFIKHTDVLSETRYVINNKEKLTFCIDFISGHLHEFLFCFRLLIVSHRETVTESIDFGVRQIWGRVLSLLLLSLTLDKSLQLFETVFSSLTFLIQVSWG